jgi:hypothetical protein
LRKEKQSAEEKELHDMILASVGIGVRLWAMKKVSETLEKQGILTSDEKKAVQVGVCLNCGHPAIRTGDNCSMHYTRLEILPYISNLCMGMDCCCDKPAYISRMRYKLMRLFTQ